MEAPRCSQSMRVSDGQCTIVGLEFSTAIRYAMHTTQMRAGQNENAPQARDPRGGGGKGWRRKALDVEVKHELVRMRAEAHRIHLTLPLVVNPGVYGILGEHVALQHELVVVLQGGQGRIQ